jgi:predicted nucleic acid-binding protein
MGRSLVKAVFDTNILIDLLKGRAEANNEVGRYSRLAISRISWIEVLTGARTSEDEHRVENLLSYFEMVELDEPVAREAISLRQQHRIRLPDAIIWATARLKDSLLVTRDSRDFPIGDPGIRVPRWVT